LRYVSSTSLEVGGSPGLSSERLRCERVDAYLCQPTRHIVAYWVEDRSEAGAIPLRERLLLNETSPMRIEYLGFDDYPLGEFTHCGLIVYNMFSPSRYETLGNATLYKSAEQDCHILLLTTQTHEHRCQM
jgi:hypothetical protein